MCLNILHLLIFQLAKRMIKKFPKLINDIYISEEWVEKEASVESSCTFIVSQVLRRECSPHGDDQRRPGDGEIFARRRSKLSGFHTKHPHSESFHTKHTVLESFHTEHGVNWWTLDIDIENGVNLTNLISLSIFVVVVKKIPFLQEPCFGNFFSTTDQQASRS